MSEPELIAVIGLSSRFPGASDTNAFWNNLVKGVVSIEPITERNLREAGVSEHDIADPNYVRSVASARGLDLFDPSFFGMTGREAVLCDPQFRIFLECCADALRNAGVSSAATWDVGVFGSSGTSHYSDLLRKSASPDWHSASGMVVGTWTNPDYLSALVSYKLGLRGPSLTLQTACSSSLVAVHLAVSSLLSGECEAALAGGVDIELPLGAGHWWEQGGPLSRDGSCRPFDVDSTGTLFGSGGGVVLLKRLDDAVRDKDPIRAVIRASGMNNDGSDKVGFTAPSVNGQAAVISDTMVKAGVTPVDVRIVEAHGTGTPLGDPIEIAGLVKAFTLLGSTTPQSVAVGSVKGNIGHLGHAAGIASLIKVILSLEHGTSVPSGSFTSVNPRIDLAGSPFYIADSVEVLDTTRGSIVAGVSSFGMGGTNSHVVLEQAPFRGSVSRPLRPSVLLWSGRSKEARDDQRTSLCDWTAKGELVLGSLSAALHQAESSPEPYRSALVVDPSDRLGEILATDGSVVTSGDTFDQRPVGFVFPGNVAVTDSLVPDLAEISPVFAQAFDKCRRLFALEDLDVDRDPTTESMTFAISYALASYWQALGVAPDFVVGYGPGEIVAGVVSGVFDLEAGVRLVLARIQTSTAQPLREALVVSAPVAALAGILSDSAGVTVAANNSPKQVVLVGKHEAFTSVRSQLDGLGISFRPASSPAVASHGRRNDVALENTFLLDPSVVLERPRVPLYIASAAGVVSDQDAQSIEFWTGRQFLPLDLTAVIQPLLDDSVVLLEVGAGRTMTTLARHHSVGASSIVPTLPASRSSQEDIRRSLLQAAANLWVVGSPARWAEADPAGDVVRAPLPGHSYQRQRFWPEQPVETRQDSLIVASHQQIDGHPFTVPHWERVTDCIIGDPGLGRGVTAVVLPHEENAVRVVLEAIADGTDILAISFSNEYGVYGSTVGVRSTHLKDDLVRLHEDLSAQDRGIDRLIHASTFQGAPRALADQLVAGYHSVITFVRSFQDAPSARTPDLVVLTSGSVDVSGGESIVPGLAALVPLVHTLVDEGVVRHGRLIDTGPVTDLLALKRTLDRPSDSVEITALRGDVEWQPAESGIDPVPLDAPVNTGGLYLVTGGSGALATVLIDEICQFDPEATVVQMSRRNNGGVAHRRGNETPLARIVEFACDVSDHAAVRNAITVLEQRWGQFRAVFHLAGVVGSGLVTMTDQSLTSATMRPKIQGTEALLDAFSDRPELDLFVAFSSRSALDGQTGGGDYAAANAVMDALVRRDGAVARRAVTVNWPAWRDIGMAVPTLQVEATRNRHVGPAPWAVVLEPTPGSILDEHRIDGSPVYPGAGTLDLVVRAALVNGSEGSNPIIRLDDVVFSTPMIVAEKTTVEVELKPVSENAWQFSVTSFVDDGSKSTHARGIVAFDGAERAESLDIGALRSRITAQQQGETTQASGVVSLGPRWNAIRSLRVSPENPGEKLLELVLPDAYKHESISFALHPALLDCGTAAARNPAVDEPHLPFYYRRLIRYGPLPDVSFAWVRRSEGADGSIVADVDFIDSVGRIVVHVEGFTMRRVVEGSVFDRAVVPLEESITVEPARGIPTLEGALLMRKILTSRLPRQVAVRPYISGIPGGIPSNASARPTLEDSSEPSAESTLERLERLWGLLLGAETVDPDSDFFDLGGNSLTAVELMTQIRGEFGVDIDLGAVFDNPTIGELTVAIDSELAS